MGALVGIPVPSPAGGLAQRVALLEDYRCSVGHSIAGSPSRVVDVGPAARILPTGSPQLPGLHCCGLVAAAGLPLDSLSIVLFPGDQRRVAQIGSRARPGVTGEQYFFRWGETSLISPSSTSSTQGFHVQYHDQVFRLETGC